MARSPQSRDAAALRRGLLAGGIAWLVGGGLLLGLTIAAGGGGRAGVRVVMLGLVLGLVVASGWLLLALVVDVLGDQVPGWRRLAVTAAVVVVTFLSPVFVVGAQG